MERMTIFHKLRSSRSSNSTNLPQVKVLSEVRSVPKFREDIPGPGVLSRSSEAFLLPQVAHGISERSEPRRRPQLVKGFLALSPELCGRNAPPLVRASKSAGTSPDHLWTTPFEGSIIPPTNYPPTGLLGPSACTA